jgi:hypothetical protein
MDLDGRTGAVLFCDSRGCGSARLLCVTGHEHTSHVLSHGVSQPYTTVTFLWLLDKNSWNAH